MTRSSFLLIALSLVLPSCNSVSLGGSERDGGDQPTGGSGGTGAIDAPVMGGQSGGASGTNQCKGLEIPDFDCGYGTPTYICVSRGNGWAWDYTCPERPNDGGQSNAQHPYVSKGDACINYLTSGYRVFPYDPSLRGDRTWPLCTLNCTTVTPAFGPAGNWPALDQALPAGACDDEGATCDSPAMTGWCAPCANGGGPGNGYTCVCRGHSWHCALVSQGMNVCQGYACIAPSVTAPPPATCSTTTWTDKQICTCGVCRDLCDSDAQCPSGRCNLNQVCKPSSDKCTGPDECPAPCRGLCEPAVDAGAPDAASCPGPNPAARTCRTTVSECIPSACECGYAGSPAGTWVCTADCRSLPLCSDAGAPDAASCPGPNPAAPTCRTSTSDCIPSGCSCGSEGSWICTADCRALPLCAADGGASDAGDGCSTGRIDNNQAATLLAQYVRQRIADNNLATTFAAEEKTVPNLWDTLQAQLFFGKMFAQDGSVWQELAFLVRRCIVTMPIDDLSFDLIESGVVANGAFYYSWSYGSGIYSSNLGKLVLDGASPVRSIGLGYRNPSSGPPGLVVALENAQLVVYRATVYWAKFNEWVNPEPMGYLKDFGDRLAVVDGTGKELPSTLP